MANSLRYLSLGVLSGVLLLAACGGDGPVDPLNKVYATVQGTAYVDWNLDGKQTPLVDAPAPGVTTALVVQGTADTVARAVAGQDGFFRMKDVPVGRYTLVAGRGAGIGDSLQVMPIDSADIILAANDTARREVRLSFATVTIASLATASIGRRVAIEGVALNSYATFGDSTIHLVDPTGYTRAVRVRPVTVNTGDSVRVFGAVGLDQGGRRVLLDGTASVLAPGRQVPPPNALSTAAVATASNGALGYAPAKITGATIVDTARVSGNWRVGVDDGSGRAELVLDANISFNLQNNLVPGATIDATGVLAPTTGLSLGGDWQLKPRLGTELTITFPTVTVSAARASAPGVKVSIEGVALNAWNVFGDSTVHVRDRTGAIRGVRVVGSVSAGDSIRLLGTMGTRNGQPVVTGATATRLLAGVGVPDPDSISTAVAAAANAGRRDADLVRVAAPILGTSTQPNQDLLVTIDDGSGRLEVLFDRTVGFNTSTVVPGAILDVRGLLVPTGTGPWRLLPRVASDFTAAYPSVTIANARTLPQGKTVYIHGIALTGAASFTEPVVHVLDGTAAIRVFRVSSTAPIFAGDSVQVLGTIAIREGQPVINSTVAETQLANVGLPALPTLSTGAAASADGGTRDAAQVKTSGTIKAVREDSISKEKLLDIDDGSGVLVVRLDKNVGFTATYHVNDRADVSGVLSPAGDGTWVLKPRRVAELTVTPAAGG